MLAASPVEAVGLDLVAGVEDLRAAVPLPALRDKDVQELSNFFERRVSAYQIAISGTVNFNADF
ncbi:MAG: hypothetical protein ACRDRY_12125 [Pseudonocardiaceae bacterium]